jgi:tRNA (cytidine/uridine-2'-O-)-methyltransferase
MRHSKRYVQPDPVRAGDSTQYGQYYSPDREFAQVRTHASLDDALASIGKPRVFALSTRGNTRYDAPRYRAGDVFLMGPETRGLPQALLDSLPEEQRLRLPMRAGNRSLNLSNAAAVVVYEAWRQLDFEQGS